MKPVILVFARYYLPGYRAGGPIRTLANMVEKLGDEFEFRIVTQDRDHADAHPYTGIKLGAWTKCGKGWVLYLSQRDIGLMRLIDLLRGFPYDIIYLNSFFNPLFTLKFLIFRRFGLVRRSPVVLAPRGEFSDGALKIKRRRKQIFIRLAKYFGLYEGLFWQASSEFEANDIEQNMFADQFRSQKFGWIRTARNITVAPDLVASKHSETMVPTTLSANRPHNPLHVCFLSRISKMKNLDFALRALSQVRVPVRFSIYGPIEDAAYWARCKDLIQTLPSHIIVAYEGVVDPAAVVEVLSQHDLFLLPTLGENFGHVIFEALLARLPLLISDQTPWRRLEDKGVGWELPLTASAAFARRIEGVAEWTSVDFDRLNGNIYAVIASIQDDPDALATNRSLLNEAIYSATER